MSYLWNNINFINPNSLLYPLVLIIYPICAILFKISALNIGLGLGENIVALILFGLIIRGYASGLYNQSVKPYQALLMLLGNAIVILGFSILLRRKIFMISVLIPILGIVLNMLRYGFMDIIIVMRNIPKWDRDKYVRNKEYIALVVVLIGLICIELSRLCYVYEE